MLPKGKRIPRKLFPIVFSGKSFSTSSLTLRIVQKSENKGPSRFSFVVSKKTLRTSAERNTFRRRGYEAIREVQKHIPDGFLCVFFLKKEVCNKTAREFHDDIHFLLRESKLLVQ